MMTTVIAVAVVSEAKEKLFHNCDTTNIMSLAPDVLL